MADKTVITPKPTPEPKKEVVGEELIYDVDSTQQEQWGPFREYTFVQTQYGEYAVPAGQIMHIELQKVWSKKEGMMVLRPKAFYEVVRTNDVRLKPIKDRTLAERAEIAAVRAERGIPERVR